MLENWFSLVWNSFALNSGGLVNLCKKGIPLKSHTYLVPILWFHQPHTPAILHTAISKREKLSCSHQVRDSFSYLANTWLVMSWVLICVEVIAFASQTQSVITCWTVSFKHFLRNNFKYYYQVRTKRKEWNVLVFVFSGEQRISVQWNSCICGSASAPWHMKLDSAILALHPSAPLCSLLWSSPRYPNSQVWLHRGHYQPQSIFLGHQGHHSPSSSIAFPTWHPGLGSPLLMSGEDFPSVFPLSHNFLLLLVSALIFTVLERFWAHLLHADRAVQCLPGLWWG